METTTETEKRLLYTEVNGVAHKWIESSQSYMRVPSKRTLQIAVSYAEHCGRVYGRAFGYEQKCAICDERLEFYTPSKKAELSLNDILHGMWYAECKT